MITIQGFAKLCGCNTQTLRYYDRIGLLTPARVDEWTGYRYYEEKQVLQFVKIKNLQQADFSIDEIRPLLDGENDRLMEAFTRKIAEQEHKLEQIRKIQQSYLTETMEMQEMLNMLADFMEGRKDDPKLWEEFGLDAAQNAAAKAKVQEILTEWFAEIRAASKEIAQQANSRELDAMKAVMQALCEGGRDKKDLIASKRRSRRTRKSCLNAAAGPTSGSGWTACRSLTAASGISSSSRCGRTARFTIPASRPCCWPLWLPATRSWKEASTAASAGATTERTTLSCCENNAGQK